MTIDTLEDYALASKQVVDVVKLSPGNFGNNVSWYELWSKENGAGSFSPGNTANGLVPTNDTLGALPMVTFSGEGKLTGIEVSIPTDAGRILIYDRLFHCGQYSGAASTVNLTAQPSYSGRIPGGTDYSGLQLFVMGAYGSLPAITITYTDQSGNGGATSTLGALNLGNGTFAQRYPLAAGDDGIQQIDTVSWATTASNAFVVVVARPIALLHARTGGAGPIKYGIMQSRLAPVYGTSCLAMLMAGWNNTTNTPFSAALEIASQ